MASSFRRQVSPLPHEPVIPLAFPISEGDYDASFEGDWHAARQGRVYPWNHRDREGRRHDGIDIHPTSTSDLPVVGSPLTGHVVAVCVRLTNHVRTLVRYRVSHSGPPPWDYRRGVDEVANLPLYGNFVWIRSSESDSSGLWTFLCHLQNEPIIRGLEAGQRVERGTPLGRMGDTGNAVGRPQLHLELHRPLAGAGVCHRCLPASASVTSIDPFPSLAAAAARDC
jgi:murein DD-endopeptidase MepM/ murein hydrolase activator NlpD